MRDTLNHLLRRPRQYWYADGLPELAIGGLFVAAGLLFAGQAAVPADSPWLALFNLGFPALVVGGVWLTRWLVGLAKARITYPRTGYVAYPRLSRRRRLLGLALGAVAGGLATTVLLALNLNRLNWIFALQGVFVGVLITFIGQGLLRFYLVGGLTALTGFALAVAGLPDARGNAIFYGLLGVSLLVSGGLTLWRYLRQNPRVPESEP